MGCIFPRKPRGYPVFADFKYHIVTVSFSADCTGRGCDSDISYRQYTTASVPQCVSGCAYARRPCSVRPLPSRVPHRAAYTGSLTSCQRCTQASPLPIFRVTVARKSCVGTDPCHRNSRYYLILARVGPTPDREPVCTERLNLGNTIDHAARNAWQSRRRIRQLHRGTDTDCMQGRAHARGLRGYGQVRVCSLPLGRLEACRPQRAGN